MQKLTLRLGTSYHCCLKEKPWLGCGTAVSLNLALDFALACPVIMRDDGAKITPPALGELCGTFGPRGPSFLSASGE